MANGPLIPGMREFDRPRRGMPAWAVWLIIAAAALVALVLATGFITGRGPLGVLGMTTTSLSVQKFRPTADDHVIQVAVALPPSGLCRDDTIDVVAFERGHAVEVDASVTRPRQDNCAVATVGGDVRWVDVVLAAALGDRAVIRLPDRQPLPNEVIS